MKKIWIIAQNNFKESLRKRTLYFLLVIAFVVIGASRFFSFLTAEEELKMIKDISFATIEFFGFLMVLFSTMGSISIEIEKRTIYTLLSKPIARKDFILGKFLGQVLILFLNFILMTIFFLALLFIKKSIPDIETFKTLLLIFVELILLSSLTLAVASFASSDAFTLIFIFFIYIIGHLITYGTQRMELVENFIFKIMGNFFYYIIPNLENFNIRDQVVIGVPVSWGYVIKTFGYGLIFISIGVLIAIYFFQKREV